jgi:anti-anti-sigma factor
MRPFDMRVERHGTTAIVRLYGEFDIVGADHLNACIHELSGNSPDEVVIDLSGVSFMDSTGLRSLIQARALASKADWSVKLVRGPDQVQRIFALTRMDDFFEFANDSERE